eukprot:PhM_4_TR9825/c2_g1_i1/m.73398
MQSMTPACVSSNAAASENRWISFVGGMTPRSTALASAVTASSGVTLGPHATVTSFEICSSERCRWCFTVLIALSTVTASFSVNLSASSIKERASTVVTSGWSRSPVSARVAVLRRWCDGNDDNVFRGPRAYFTAGASPSPLVIAMLSDFASFFDFLFIFFVLPSLPCVSNRASSEPDHSHVTFVHLSRRVSARQTLNVASSFTCSPVWPRRSRKIMCSSFRLLRTALSPPASLKNFFSSGSTFNISANSPTRASSHFKDAPAQDIRSRKPTTRPSNNAVIKPASTPDTRMVLRASRTSFGEDIARSRI